MSTPKAIIMLWQVGSPKKAGDALLSIQQGVQHFNRKYGVSASVVVVREEQAVAWGLDGSVEGCRVVRAKKALPPGCVEVIGQK